MISSPTPPDTLANLELNTFWDGVFHAATWIITVVGVVMLLLTERPATGTGRRFVGGLLVGWGSFNLVEGVMNHHVLGLHHVRPGHDVLLWDVGFLAWGALMLALGSALVLHTTRSEKVSVPRTAG
jgi:uncharacterized membrane protein